MIIGVISQVGKILPHGMLGLTQCYSDYEKAFSPFIAFDVGGDQLLSAAFVPEAAELFFAPAIPKVMNTGVVASDDSAFAPILKVTPVLAPSFYFADDMLSLPSIAIPGFFQVSFYIGDDAIFTPFVFGPGSLRPILINALDVVFAPVLTAPLTLKPIQHVDVDSLVAPIVRIGFLLSPFVNDADTIFAPSRTSPGLLVGSFVIDGDINYVPAVGRMLNMGLVAGDDVIYAPSEAGGNTIMAPTTVVGDAETIYAAIFVGPTTFDSGTVANVALSNGNLTATHSSAANNSGARSIAYKSSGKYYFEVTMTATHGTGDCVGVLLSTGTYTDLVSIGANCVAIYKSLGSIYANGAYSGKQLGTCTSGDVISVAIDLTARKAWLCKNGGLWNGLALTSENPNTGLGGVTVGAGSFAPAVGFGGTGTAASDAMTGNFGATAFGTSVPTGFNNWTT